MPLGPHSTARLLVIARTADFAIADGTVKARPVMVEVERMLSTTPLCFPSIQRLPAASAQYIAPCSVGARIASAARNDSCSVCAMKVAAALLTRTSSGASRQTASIIASTAAPSRMSHLTAAALPPKSSRIRAAASSNSSRRPQIISSAPSATKRRPIAAPSREPPVTSIRFPANRPFSNIVSSLVFPPSLRGANGSRERAPDDRLRDEAIHFFVCRALDCFAPLATTYDGPRRRPKGQPNQIVARLQIRHEAYKATLCVRNSGVSMKAILCTQYCGPDDLVLTEVPDPVAGPGEAVIAIKSAPLNFFDLLLIQGKYQLKPPFPFSPPPEVAGVIESVGSGVTGLKVGDRVVASSGHNGPREQIALPANSLVKTPDNLDFDRPAGILISYGTTPHA